MLRERLLLSAGLVLLALSFLVTEILNRPFHIEFVIASLALCGIPITTQWVASTRGE